MRGFGATLACILVMAGMTRVADAQERGQEDPAVTCKQAVVRLIAALDAADAEALRTLIYLGSRKPQLQQEGLDAVIQCVVAQRRLEEAVARRWGGEAAKPFSGEASLAQADRSAIQNARVEMIEHREGLVILGPNVAPIVVRRGDDSIWRVVVQAARFYVDDSGKAFEPGSLKRIRYFRAVGGALRQVTAQVNDGTIPSADAARAALDKAVEQAVTASARDPG